MNASERLAVIDRMDRIKAGAEKPFANVRSDGLIGVREAVDELCNTWEELVLDLLDGNWV